MELFYQLLNVRRDKFKISLKSNTYSILGVFKSTVQHTSSFSRPCIFQHKSIEFFCSSIALPHCCTSALQLRNSSKDATMHLLNECLSACMLTAYSLGLMVNDIVIYAPLFRLPAVIYHASLADTWPLRIRFNTFLLYIYVYSSCIPPSIATSQGFSLARVFAKNVFVFFANNLPSYSFRVSQSCETRVYFNNSIFKDE